MLVHVNYLDLSPTDYYLYLQSTIIISLFMYLFIDWLIRLFI